MVPASHANQDLQGCAANCIHALAEIFQRHAQAFFKIYLWFPMKNSSRLRDIRTTLLGIVLRQWLEDDGCG